MSLRFAHLSAQYAQCYWESTSPSGLPSSRSATILLLLRIFFDQPETHEDRRPACLSVEHLCLRCPRSSGSSSRLSTCHRVSRQERTMASLMGLRPGTRSSFTRKHKARRVALIPRRKRTFQTQAGNRLTPIYSIIRVQGTRKLNPSPHTPKLSEDSDLARVTLYPA